MTMQVGGVAAACAAPIAITGSVAAQSSLTIRILSAAGSALVFLTATLERVSAFGAGFATGITLFKNPEQSFSIAVYAFVALSVINASKCILFGPGTFIYSTFSDSLLAGMGFGTGIAAGLLGSLQS